MASSLLPITTVSGGSFQCAKANDILFPRSFSFGKAPSLPIVRKLNGVIRKQKLSVNAKHQDVGADFVAGFLLGGAVFGTLGYIFAPQIRRSLLNEDEYGFRRPRQPIYYDDGLETTRQTLNDKISQLNSAIDTMSSRLTSKIRNKVRTVPVKNDPEVEATI